MKGTLWLNLGDSYSSGGRETTTNQTVRVEPGIFKRRKRMEEKPKTFEVCQCCTDPVYDDHREFEVDGKKACLKCWVEAINTGYSLKEEAK